MKGSEARSKQGEDIAKLKTDTTVLREGLASADASLKSLAVASSNHRNKIEAAAQEALQMAANITVLRDQTNQLIDTARFLYFLFCLCLL
jgi:hypothetical protein